MPKAYWIAHITVTDPDGYPDYIKAGTPVYEKFGGKFLVRGGTCEGMEGNTHSRNVVIEWPDYETALMAYHSEEYQAARAIRNRCSDADVVIVEGVD